MFALAKQGTIDDVYQDGKPDYVHELLSTAIREGFSTIIAGTTKIPFIPGVDKIPDSFQLRTKNTSRTTQIVRERAEATVYGTANT